MKKNYTFILACLLSINAFILKAQAPVPDLIHYKFDGTGTLVNNYASAPPVGAATATLMGAITQTGAINCLGAGVGSGVSSTTDYLNTGWTTSLTASWSISFWCKNISTNTTLYYIFGDNTANSFRCFTNGVAGSTNWILRGGGLTDIYANGAALTTPKMVTFVYDQPNNVAYSYIDGVLASTVAQGSVGVVGTAFKVYGYGSNVGAPVGGNLADYRVYGSALTATQVAAVYAATSLTAISVSVTGSSSACSGQTVALTASGANSYLWNTSSTNTAIVVSPSVSTSYTVVGTSGTCTNSAVSSVSVNPSPTVTVNSATICSGNSFTMIPSGASTYTFSSGSAVVSPSANTSYSVTGTSSLGCVSAPAVSTVSVNPNPTVTAVSNASLICAGQTASLTASGATTYLWNTSSTNTVLAVTPSVTTSYTVTGTTNGCSNAFIISQAVSACTGINANAATVSQINVYPNPNTGVFTIELNNGSVKNIEVMDLTGRVILSSSSANDKVDFNINTLANGIYYVRIQSNNTVEVIKIVKE